MCGHRQEPQRKAWTDLNCCNIPITLTDPDGGPGCSWRYGLIAAVIIKPYVLNSHERHVHHIRRSFLPRLCAPLGGLEPLGKGWTAINATTMESVLPICFLGWRKFRHARLLSFRRL